MEFSNKIKELAKNVETLRCQISSEEATKMSMVVPFFSTLGYDVFNPSEFCPEYTADVGIKKGEKVDYAILKNGKVEILIECKSCGVDLDNHVSQLYRYFGVSEAKFGVLTNGVIYRFYTDSHKVNIMDLTPFLEVDLGNLKPKDIEEIRKFCKDSYNRKQIADSVENMIYESTITGVLNKEFANPSNDFIRFLLSDLNIDLDDDRVVSTFAPLVKRVLKSYVSNLIVGKVTSAMEDDDIEVVEKKQEAIVYNYSDRGIYSEVFQSIIDEVMSWEHIERRDVKAYIGFYVRRKKFAEISVGSDRVKVLLAGILPEDMKPSSTHVEAKGSNGLMMRKIGANWTVRDEFVLTDTSQLNYLMGCIKAAYLTVVRGIDTTEYELEAYKEFLRVFKGVTGASKISYMDTLNAFEILYEGDLDKVICSFVFKDNKAVLKLPKEDGKFKNYDFDGKDIKGILEKNKDTITGIINRYR